MERKWKKSEEAAGLRFYYSAGERLEWRGFLKIESTDLLVLKESKVSKGEKDGEKRERNDLCRLFLLHLSFSSSSSRSLSLGSDLGCHLALKVSIIFSKCAKHFIP